MRKSTVIDWNQEPKRVTKLPFDLGAGAWQGTTQLFHKWNIPSIRIVERRKMCKAPYGALHIYSLWIFYGSTSGSCRIIDQLIVRHIPVIKEIVLDGCIRINRCIDLHNHCAGTSATLGNWIDA